MFLHVFKNSFKILIRDKTVIFWTIIFSILLAVMFKFGLSGLTKVDKFETIPVAINEEALKDKYFKTYIDTIEKEEYIKATLISREIDGIKRDEETIKKEILDNKEIIAYIENEESILMTKRGSVIQETIVKSLLDGYLQNKSLIMNIMKEKGEATLVSIDDFLKIDTYIEDVSNENMNIMNTYFYTLIGMQAIYSFIWGLKVMFMHEANLSTQGKRNSVAPIKKITCIFASILVAWLLSIISCAITMVFIYYILEVNIGDKLLEIIVLVILGTLTGVSFGAFIAVSNKKSIETKNGIGIGITMLWSFLAGMMQSAVKILIEKNLPIINKLNPVALITDGMYSLYYYNTLDRFYENIIYLSAITIFFILGMFFFMRGKKYENL